MFEMFKKQPNISCEDLKDKLRGKITLLDVRTTAEYRNGHINKAKNVPLDTINSYNNNIKEEIYVICQSGMRSKSAQKILQKKGYNVINVKGGMNSWYKCN